MNYFNYIDITDCIYEYSNILNVSETYPAMLTEYYTNLAENAGSAVIKQCIPSDAELIDHCLSADPLSETELSPVPGLIHRYPDRVVLLVSNKCPVYCRFCMRKRLVGQNDLPISFDDFKAAVEYISANPEIRDVIVSGGDPLMLDDNTLHYMLSEIRSIQSVEIIRIGTRIPVTYPQRITEKLCSILKEFHPLYINTHFNHPEEITVQSTTACTMLADAGIPLGNQTVLLRDINDNIETLKALFTGLLKIRVKPYYLHQMDLVKGTFHFRTSVRHGLELMRGLRGHISGMAVPHYVIDLPGGKGKVAIIPDTAEFSGKNITLRTYTGEMVVYEDL